MGALILSNLLLAALWLSSSSSPSWPAYSCDAWPTMPVATLANVTPRPCRPQPPALDHQPQAQWPAKVLSSAPPAFCDACGPEDKFCSQYGAHNLARSRLYEGANARLRRLLRAARDGHAPRIAVIGGSVTCGQGVGHEAAWPARFEAWWNASFPGAQTSVQNGAMHATGSDYFSMCFQEHIDVDGVDLIITDHSINDDRVEGHARSFEWLMRALLELPSKPAVINLQLPHLKFPIISTGGDMHLPLSAYYDVPYISMRNVVLPQIQANGTLVQEYFAGQGTDRDTSHISAAGHDMVADLLGAYIQRQLCALDAAAPTPDDRAMADWATMEDVPRLRLLEPWSTTARAPHIAPFCATTTTARHRLAPAENSGWTENWTAPGDVRAAKPYIRATAPGARVAFAVQVSGLGRVRMSYLRSGTFGLGSVRCWLDDDEAAAVKIDGYWSSPFNLAKTAVITERAAPGAHLVRCELLKETADPGHGTEFRIIAVDAA